MSIHSGQKLFFPNIVFRLVRSTLPPHQALFRIPRQVNKLDVKAYLKAIYDVEVTDVRTANYNSKMTTDIKNSSLNKRAAMVRTPAYKRAIVTMKQDFVFPAVPKVGENGVQPLPPANIRAYPARNRENFRLDFYKDFYTEMSNLSRRAEAIERGEEVAEPPKQKLGYLSAKRKRIVDGALKPLRDIVEERIAALPKKAKE
ncbi:hypothetical protein SmJEL517_g05245 [Synchytrium microbalum]|uniref:Large ribosomal subunit protein uL23m n=1 Tax=Synchytrium microbalum TaxID=1806994 RepID=A0A507BWA1_9FUNG|nr:uncharacterized protein SmJEL517_g05245 [Synchytrium microbalum]TPX31401.1 hypothetical protein SmJEL517_g05245 [Synchytrium microbalum]